MATNPFGNVTLAQPTTTTTGLVNGAAGTHDTASDAALNQSQQPAEPPLDINDPLLTSESLTVVEGDAFADPPPVPDAIYRVKLSLRGVPVEGSSDVLPWVPEKDVDKKTGLLRGAFAKTLINIQIVDPSGTHDGLYLQMPFKWADTRVGKQSGTSKVMTILNLLKRPDGTPWITKGQALGHKALIELFVKALAGEPELRVRSEWEWNCQQCGKEAQAMGRYANGVNGMTKFPASKTVRGAYDPEMRCQANPAHGYSKARPMAAQFLALQ